MRNVIQWNKAQEAFPQDEANLKRCPITNENEDEVNSPCGKSSPRKQEKKKSTTRNIKNDEQQGPANVWTSGKVLLSRPQGQLPSSNISNPNGFPNILCSITSGKRSATTGYRKTSQLMFVIKWDTVMAWTKGDLRNDLISWN